MIDIEIKEMFNVETLTRKIHRDGLVKEPGIKQEPLQNERGHRVEGPDSAEATASRKVREQSKRRRSKRRRESGDDGDYGTLNAVQCPMDSEEHTVNVSLSLNPSAVSLEDIDYALNEISSIPERREHEELESVYVAERVLSENGRRGNEAATEPMHSALSPHSSTRPMARHNNLYVIF